MDAILSLDYDFFVKPTYFGSYFAEKDWNSYEDFKAASSEWMAPTTFFEKLKINKPIRGCSVPDNMQTIYNIKKMFDENVVKRSETQIVLFDAHPNIYYWNTVGVIDNWGLADFSAYNSTIAFFKEKLVDTVIWVTPDYMTGDLFKKHFENMQVFRDKNIIIPYVSQECAVRIKMLKWSEFIAQNRNLNWKYLAFTTNHRMCNHTQENLKLILDHISQY